MDKGKGKEANNSLVSSVVIRDNIVKLLDFLESLKNEMQTNLDFMDVTERMRLALTIMLRVVQFSYLYSDDINATICHKSYEVQSLVDANDVLIHLHRYIRIVISAQSYSQSSSTVNKEHLVEHLDSLLMNLHDLSRVGSIFPLMTQYKVLPDVCTNVRDFHKLIVNGCVEHEIVEYVVPQFQLMAERVGNFCLVLSADLLPDSVKLDGELDVPPIHVRLGHLLEEIIPVELEVMDICFINLRASKSADIGCFIDELLKASPSVLTGYLICLEDHMMSVTSASTSIKEIHVMIEFLLVIVTDMPTDLIYPDKLFDLLSHVGELTKEVSILVRKLVDISRNEVNTNDTNTVVMHLRKSIEKLKGDLKLVYLKVPSSSELCFHVSDGPLFMNLLLNNLNDLFHSDAYSVALIKEEIRLVKEDLEFIRSFLGNVEQELNKDIWERVLDLSYEAKAAINSILSRDNGLMHLIFSLPNARENIKLIKEEVSSLTQMISKNRDLIVVNPDNKLAGNKSLTDGQINVGFREETDWLIRKLTNGPAELDVISIIGMPGAGKTTLANKVYNDRYVISHFDIRAWCTVGKEYNRKMVLQKLFNQVTGLDEKLREDIDIDDALRKKLYGGRYLIVLDDLWDISTWDDLTRCFPLIEKGSRIILTSRKREVALDVKRHSDPLEIIHHYVEILDRYFGSVCELDLIFNFHKAYYILDELLIAGELQENCCTSNCCTGFFGRGCQRRSKLY